MNFRISRLLLAMLALGAGEPQIIRAAAPASITVSVDKPSHRVPSTLWGIFFEDINCSIDGGIYAELVRNRSLEDSDKPDHWSLVARGSGKGDISVSLEQPMTDDLLTMRNRRALRLRVTSADPANPVGVANEGFWGMALVKDARYDLTLHARSGDGFTGNLQVELQKPDGSVCARGELKGVRGDWKSFKLSLVTTATEPEARLVISATRPGTVWLDMVSLMPRETWKQRDLRPDLMEKLADLKPGFVRFPGGCWVEGDTMDFAYRWKDTIGDSSLRRTHYNIWQYYATHGVGFHEYLQMSEDLGAEPLFVINCGMSHKENVPLDQMGPFIQDALDAVEYCNGPASSRYGALRVKNGHAAPFHLKYLEIGNENGGKAYAERWELFNRAIKSRYPEIILVANHWAGGYPTNVMPRIVDEHYYSSPKFFIQHAGQYDKYDRAQPKVYVGEYAVTQGCGQGNLRAAIGEAAFMTGLERNSDVVVMASYAPLFANVNYKKWNPDLICYDSSRSYGLPSYYVQQLFSRNRGDVVLPVRVVSPLTQETQLGGSIGVGTWSTVAEFKDMKVVANGRIVYEWKATEETKGWKTFDGKWLVADGVLRQSSQEQNVRALLDAHSFTNYTYTLKARKLSGDEGFLIPFNVTDAGAKSWWNVGGWGNDHHALELGGVIGNEKKGRVETNRWYDLRIEVTGTNVKCFLDGELTNEGHVPELTSLHASATRDEKAGEVILKIVNSSTAPLETEVKLEGISRLPSLVKGVMLTSAKGEDENSLDHPDRVAPKEVQCAASGNTIRHAFPGNSFTILRVRPQ